MEIDADFILGKIEMMRLRKICKNEKELKKTSVYKGYKQDKIEMRGMTCAVKNMYEIGRAHV